MSIESNCKKLGVDCKVIELDKRDRKWISPITQRETSVEEAVLEHFIKQGWKGYSREGGLILNLIKAASFKKIDDRYLTRYVESLYHHKTCKHFGYKQDSLIKSVSKTSNRIVSKNLQLMLGGFIQSRFSQLFPNSGIRKFFPGFKYYDALDFYKAFKRKNLLRVTKIFSKDPYQYRKGWPDLTLWKNDSFLFVEVKAQGDSLQPSQKKLIEDILLPLDLPVQVVKVLPRNRS